MIENFVIVSSVEQARSRYQLKTGKQYVPIKSPSLVSGTDLVWVITSQDPFTLQTMRFGFTSYRSDTWTDLLNIPTDTLYRDEDDSDYDHLISFGLIPRPLAAYLVFAFWG